MLDAIVRIYTLEDPRSGDIRYVGKTVKALSKRRAEHCVPSQLARYKTHTSDWIKSLINKGIKPVIRLIEEVPVSEWEFAERFWIDYYISLGYQLTNCSPGGESGALGYKHTPEAVEKIRAANLGRKMPDWFPDFISKRDWGKKHTEETRRNMSIAHWGYKATEEAKRNMSIAMKKSWAERRTKAGG